MPEVYHYFTSRPAASRKCFAHGSFGFLVRLLLRAVRGFPYSGHTCSSDFSNLFLGKRFDANERVSSGANPNQLVELGLNGRPVAVLRILNNKDHQEGNDTGAGINNELPGI
jgi:hypothetical protein